MFNGVSSLVFFRQENVGVRSATEEIGASMSVLMVAMVTAASSDAAAQTERSVTT